MKRFLVLSLAVLAINSYAVAFEAQPDLFIECKAHHSEEECLTDPRCDWDKASKVCHNIEANRCAIADENGVCMVPLRDVVQ